MAGAVAGTEIWRFLAPARAEVGHTVYATLGEAVVANDLRGVMGFIERGQSPDALIDVHDAVLTGGQTVRVPPVVWASAAGRSRIVLALLGSGVTFERPVDRLTPCVADWMGFDEIAAQVRLVARLPPPANCPPQPDGPLLHAIATAGSH
jgi:hypothetical protein